MRVPPLYLASVCLERNRWGSRKPSIVVSDWLERIRRDGFDGVELWENHYLAAEEAERKRLREMQEHIPILNGYASFTDDGADGRERLLEAATKLHPTSVKYNVGPDVSRIEEYRRNLLAWADALPAGCRALCECHPGTVVESLDAAARFFADLDPARFPVIAHVTSDADSVERSVRAWGARLVHVHIQLREPADATAEGRARFAACVRVLKAHGYAGSASIEFTRGISRDEQVETIYANAIADAAAFRDAWG